MDVNERNEVAYEIFLKKVVERVLAGTSLVEISNGLLEASRGELFNRETAIDFVKEVISDARSRVNSELLAECRAIFNEKNGMIYYQAHDIYGTEDDGGDGGMDEDFEEKYQEDLRREAEAEKLDGEEKDEEDEVSLGEGDSEEKSSDDDDQT